MGNKKLPPGTGYYVIRGAGCKRDKEGNLICRCGFCRPITGDVIDYNAERYLKMDTERDRLADMMIAYAENALRPGAAAAEQTHLETVLEQLRQMTQTDWALRD